jgi:hypothetical protein
MIESRACSACGGRVDVIMVPEEVEDGHSVQIRVGACERCGTLFNEEEGSELPPPRRNDDYDLR